MSDRSRRATDKQPGGGGRDGKAKGALAQLRALRESGKKHLDDYEVREEDDVYEVMDDAEYSKLVNKRRQEGGAWWFGVPLRSTLKKEQTQDSVAQGDRSKPRV